MKKSLLVLSVAAPFVMDVAVAAKGKKIQARPVAKLRKLEGLSGGSGTEGARSRSLALFEKGYFLAAMAERRQLMASGQGNAGDARWVAELGLALNRLENLPADGSGAGRAAAAALALRDGGVARARELLGGGGGIGEIRLAAAKTRAYMTLAAVQAADNQVRQAIETLGAVPELQGVQAAWPRLQRARLFYDLGAMSQALEELARVPKSSPYWYDGVFLAAWAAYRVKDDNLVLGQTMTLNNPHLDGKFNPESHILEAASLYRLCHYESARRAIRHLRGKYGTLGNGIARIKNSGGAAQAILRYVRGEGDTEGFSDKDWTLIVDGVASQSAFLDADRLLVQIDREQAALKDSGYMRPAYQAELDAARREAMGIARKSVARRLPEMEQEVNRQLEAALAIEVEINTRIRDRLMSKLEPRRKEVDFEAEVKKGYEFWPFEGEYWRDEVGGYTFATSDVCSSSERSDEG